ncbi:MAG: hypothetical protein AAGC55_17360, partial [Myxococcota bacterium]
LALGRFFINADIRYVEKWNVTAEVENIYIRTTELPLFDTVRVGTASATIGIDPLIMKLTAGAYF